jgi:predicted RNA binding protein YcfA (HicA-like mRNA interferase family)
MATDLYRRIVSILRENGCGKVREGKGSHEIWYSPTNKRNVSVPVTIKSRHTCNAILRQAGLTVRI